MKKRDWFLIGGLLLLAVVAFVFLSRARTSPTYVTIYVHDEVYRRVPITEYQSITVDQGDGRVNVICITKDGVCMESSTCKNQLCVHQGVLSSVGTDDLVLGNWIICLPNGVSVELSDGGGA